MIRVYPITPVSAPRQVGRDAYNPSAHVKRYRAFRDLVQLHRIEIPMPFHHVIFVLPMPPSWSLSKRAHHEGKPHQQKPDRDNLEKALLDSVFGDDEHIYDGRATKVWGKFGLILISSESLVLPAEGLALWPIYAHYAEKGWSVIGHKPLELKTDMQKVATCAGNPVCSNDAGENSHTQTSRTNPYRWNQEAGLGRVSAPLNRKRT